jgi:hypothetical protein
MPTPGGHATLGQISRLEKVASHHRDHLVANRCAKHDFLHFLFERIVSRLAPFPALIVNQGEIRTLVSKGLSA